MTAFVTMKDVAKEAGVHHSTVSLCLKNSPRIPAATRERVLRVARRLGYRPHPYLTTLMQSRRKGRVGTSSPTLALVTFSSTRDSWKAWMPEFEACVESARSQAQTRGFRLEEFWAPLGQSSSRRLGEILYTRGIAGALLAPVPQTMETLDWHWDRLAVVALGPSLQEPRVHRVRSNHFQSMVTVMNECHRLGYRRVGLALKEEVSRKMEQRWIAPYLLKQFEFKISRPPQPLLALDWNQEVFLSWLTTEKPDAVIAINIRDTAAWLGDAGYRIPEDIGLVSLSAPREGRQTGTFQDWPMQGKRAVNLLIDLLQDNLFGLHDHPNLLIVPSHWNPGQTLRPQRNTQ